MGSEYSWSKTEILERVYLDELFYLTQEINNRKMQEYRMQLAIVQNPYVKNPQQLWSLLEQNIRVEDKQDRKELDIAGMERLKDAMRHSGSGVMVKG